MLSRIPNNARRRSDEFSSQIRGRSTMAAGDLREVSEISPGEFCYPLGDVLAVFL